MLQPSESILQIPIGAAVSVKGKSAKVVGRLHEKYVHACGAADAYILALEGERELGAERRGEEWSLWTSQFRRNVNNMYIGPIKRAMQEPEAGRIERVYSEGKVCNNKPRYVFGTIGAGGVFLAHDSSDCEIWFSQGISTEDVDVEG